MTSPSSVLLELAWVDYLILALYFVFVLGIGWTLKKHLRTSSDFFESGRSLPAWICALGFVGANLGAQEVIGMAASGAKYGLLSAHFYWVGAIPAMVFLGLFMMPFYYGSKVRSVPEYLKLRFDEKTRALNALSFAVMTVFSSGISMFALAKLLNAILDWNFDLCLIASSLVVLVYIYAGGLTSAIYNEVSNFFSSCSASSRSCFSGSRTSEVGVGSRNNSRPIPRDAACRVHGPPPLPTPHIPRTTR